MPSQAQPGVISSVQLPLFLVVQTNVPFSTALHPSQRKFQLMQLPFVGSVSLAFHLQPGAALQDVIPKYGPQFAEI